jgi:hypothetical protein
MGVCFTTIHVMQLEETHICWSVDEGGDYVEGSDVIFKYKEK